MRMCILKTLLDLDCSEIMIGGAHFSEVNVGLGLGTRGRVMYRRPNSLSHNLSNIRHHLQHIYHNYTKLANTVNITRPKAIISQNTTHTYYDHVQENGSISACAGRPCSRNSRKTQHRITSPHSSTHTISQRTAAVPRER